MNKLPIIIMALLILMVTGTLVLKKWVLDDSASSDYTNGYGTMTDSRDGQSYRTVKIGNQIWMAENLNFEVPNSYCYKNSADSCTKYGHLYMWSAAMDSAGTFSPYGIGCGMGKPCTPQYPVQGVCPKKWHLPSAEEWETLLNEVGGKEVTINNKFAYKSLSGGNILKSTSGWSNDNNGYDLYFFSVLPSGNRKMARKKGKREPSYRDRGVTNYTDFWSSTEANNPTYALFVSFTRSDTINFIYGLKEFFSFSIRCVKD
jgi:Fibrobacter succinogenes major domain (Fib_succ_major).